MSHVAAWHISWTNVSRKRSISGNALCLLPSIKSCWEFQNRNDKYLRSRTLCQTAQCGRIVSQCRAPGLRCNILPSYASSCSMWQTCRWEAEGLEFILKISDFKTIRGLFSPFHCPASYILKRKNAFCVNGGNCTNRNWPTATVLPTCCQCNAMQMLRCFAGF